MISADRTPYNPKFVLNPNRQVYETELIDVYQCAGYTLSVARAMAAKEMDDAAFGSLNEEMIYISCDVLGIIRKMMLPVEEDK